MFSELLFTPSKSKTKQKPQIPDIEMETSLIPQARFLLDSKANCTGTQKIPGSPASLRYTKCFLCDLTKALWLYISHNECLIRISLPKSSRNTSQKPPGGSLSIRAVFECPHKQRATLQVKITLGVRTAYICLEFIGFFSLLIHFERRAQAEGHKLKP